MMRGEKPVLVPEDETRAIEALRFSLASDIVELLVLTVDDAFLQTLRAAVTAPRRLWHVSSSDKISDLLIAGGVGILVLDAHVLGEMAASFITAVKRQFPDLVVVLAGHRDAESTLARLVSDGTVYRFIHKPVSPARARLFADAAVKRYEELRSRAGHSAPARAPRDRGLFLVAGAAAWALLGGIWLLRHETRIEREPAANETRAPAPPTAPPPARELEVLSARAAAALAANRLTAPSGDNALELYQRELARNPSDAEARAGVAEVRERLLSLAENNLLEERLEEAAAAIETARKAGAEGGRIAFLAGQLAKARAQQKAAASLAHLKTDAAGLAPAAAADGDSAADGHTAPDGHSPAARAEQLAALALQRIEEAHLTEPEGDNARAYVQQALAVGPASEPVQEAQQALALRLAGAVRSAIDRRDFPEASKWLAAADGIAAPANVENLTQALAAARRQADADAARELLKSVEERLAQDRLIEPADDSAKYYLLTLRGLDPTNAGLAQVTQELGARLVAKGRYALRLQQYDAARSWMEEAGAIGYSSPEGAAVLKDLEAALVRQQFLSSVIGADKLELVESVQPIYPAKAEQSGIEGWVELDFTVTDAGNVADIAVHGASPSGVFESAAIRALSQWRYKPVLKDSSPVAQRARIRIRFQLPR